MALWSTEQSEGLWRLGDKLNSTLSLSRIGPSI